MIGQWVTDREPGSDEGMVLWIYVAELERTIGLALANGGQLEDPPADDGAAPPRRHPGPRRQSHRPRAARRLTFLSETLARRMRAARADARRRLPARPPVTMDDGGVLLDRSMGGGRR